MAKRHLSFVRILLLGAFAGPFLSGQVVSGQVASGQVATPPPVLGTPVPQAPQAAGQTGASAPHTVEAGSEKQLIKVVISTSRPEVGRNHAWGLTADLSNTGTEAVRIAANEVALETQPETAGESTCIEARNAVLPNTKGDTSSDGDIVLQPGEHFVLFWDEAPAKANNAASAKSKTGSSNPCNAGVYRRFVEDVNFTPGPYTFVVQGKLHLLSETPEQYHTFASTVSVKVEMVQFDIMWCAGFGAFLAYLVVATRQAGGDIDKIQGAVDRKARFSALWTALVHALAAFLLGAVLSVVANRLSDTQFPLKVSVQDVWGGITIGFMAYFAGNKFIDKLQGTPTPPPPPSDTPAPETVRPG